MAATEWDLVNDRVIYDSDLFDHKKNKWVREAAPPFKSKPSMQEAYKAFSKVLNVNTDKETGMVTISVEHVSPKVARQWVNWLIEDINLEMKIRDVVEATRSTEFLTQQLEETRIADIRSVLYKLVEEQAKTIMFANVRDEYIFKTIDPALVPEVKSKPKRALIVILGSLLGGVFSVMFVLIQSFLRRDNYVNP